MLGSALRSSAIFLIIAGSLALLSGCGSNNLRACNAAGCCGTADTCVAPRYLYANGLKGQIMVFPVEGNGMLGSPTSISGPAGSLGMAEFNNQFLYVSNPTVQTQHTIDAWSIDLGTGLLTPVNGSPFSTGLLSVATGFAVNTSAQVLYAADAARIDAFQVDATGALTPLPGSPFPAGVGLYLAIDSQNRFVFSTDDTPPGHVLAFTVDATGALTAVPGSPFVADPNSTANTRPFQIVVDSTGSFVYVALNATNQIAAFSIAPTSGVLTPVPGSPFAAGLAPVSLTTASNVLYVSNELDGTVSGYTIGSNGVLTPVPGSPFPIRAGAVTTDPFGALLYASTGQAVVMYSIAPTGALSQVGATPASSGASVLTFVQ